MLKAIPQFTHATWVYTFGLRSRLGPLKQIGAFAQTGFERSYCFFVLANGFTSKKGKRKLRAVLPELDETSRKVFLMRYVQKKSYSHISQELGKNVSQIRMLCYKALHQARCLMEKRS